MRSAASRSLRRILEPEMGPWSEVVGVIALACVGAVGGHFVSRLRRPYWLLGMIVPLLMLIGMTVHGLESTPPFSWLVPCRRENAAAAVLVTMVFFTTLKHLPSRRRAVLVVALAVAAEIHFALMPFLLPALAQPYFRSLRTVVDGNGVCMQNTYYTCGPAAAVTALKRLGIEAEEGEIAILARMRPGAGVHFDMLAQGLERHYKAQGLRCAEKRCETVEDLQRDGICLVSTRLMFRIRHCVAVLEVTDAEVVVGDPLVGLRRLTRAQFRRAWSGDCLVLSRDRGKEAGGTP